MPISSTRFRLADYPASITCLILPHAVSPPCRRRHDGRRARLDYRRRLAPLRLFAHAAPAARSAPAAAFTPRGARRQRWPQHENVAIARVGDSDDAKRADVTLTIFVYFIGEGRLVFITSTMS